MIWYDISSCVYVISFVVISMVLLVYGVIKLLIWYDMKWYGM